MNDNITEPDAVYDPDADRWHPLPLRPQAQPRHPLPTPNPGGNR